MPVFDLAAYLIARGFQKIGEKFNSFTHPLWKNSDDQPLIIIFEECYTIGNFCFYSIPRDEKQLFDNVNGANSVDLAGNFRQVLRS